MRTRTKLLFTASVLGVVGLLVVLATGAFFSATTEAQGNIAGTGTMSVDCSTPVDETTNNTVCGDIFVSPGPATMKPVATGLPSLRDNLAAARAPSATVDGYLQVNVNPTLRIDRLVLSQNNISGTDPDGAGPLTTSSLAGILNVCVGDEAVDAIATNDPDPDAGGPLDETNTDPTGDCDVYMGPFNMGAAQTTAFDVANPLTPLAIAVGGNRTFLFDVWFPDDGSDHNVYQGQDAQANFRMTAS
ncbi:MAG: hypothetical protein WAP35_05210 [Solirubrobacterales bacterium]